MNDPSHLVTVHCFKGKDYLVKMTNQNKNSLDITITDKITSEDWHCSYDATYVENLTHKTGNFKQFSIFTTMLKSALLKTSESVSLDLLTFDDLEALRSRRIIGRTLTSHPNNILPLSASNRRYLILTYSVEFDRIHYPLPMDYCGLPDPHILQATIRRLEQEIIQLQEQLKHSDNQNRDEDLHQMNFLQKRVVELTEENEQLREDVACLKNQLSKKFQSQKRTESLEKALTVLEEQMKKEKANSYHQIRCLKEEKTQLLNKLEEFKLSEKNLRAQLRKALSRKPSPFNSLNHVSRYDNFRKPSPSQSLRGQHFSTKILQENKSSNGLDKEKWNNKKNTPQTILKSDLLITNVNQRSSSVSSTENYHKNCNHSSKRSSSNESIVSLTNRNTGINFRLKPKKNWNPDHSSSESSTTSKKYKRRNFSMMTSKNSKTNKDMNSEVRINDLEKRISNLQQILESDLTLRSKKH